MRKRIFCKYPQLSDFYYTCDDNSRSKHYISLLSTNVGSDNHTATLNLREELLPDLTLVGWIKFYGKSFDVYENCNDIDDEICDQLALFELPEYKLDEIIKFNN